MDRERISYWNKQIFKINWERQGTVMMDDSGKLSTIWNEQDRDKKVDKQRVGLGQALGRTGFIDDSRK